MLLLIASLFTGFISVVAVFHRTDSLVLRIFGVLLGLSAGGSVFTFAQTNKNLERSLLSLTVLTILGLVLCWPVFDLFRDWAGLDSYWSVSKIHRLGWLVFVAFRWDCFSAYPS